MPQLIYTRAAVADLVRLRAFLQTKSPSAASNAKTAIVRALSTLNQFPQAHRPVADQPGMRELIIQFGASGYVARYHYAPGLDIVVLRIRHQKEEEFTEGEFTGNAQVP